MSLAFCKGTEVLQMRKRNNKKTKHSLVSSHTSFSHIRFISLLKSSIGSTGAATSAWLCCCCCCARSSSSLVAFGSLSAEAAGTATKTVAAGFVASTVLLLASSFLIVLLELLVGAWPAPAPVAPMPASDFAQFHLLTFLLQLLHLFDSSVCVLLIVLTN